MAHLFKLLDFDEAPELIDAYAIIKEARKNPHHVDLMYIFSISRDKSIVNWMLPFSRSCRICPPLHQAIVLGLGVEVINALNTPKAIRQLCDTSTALHLACQHRASIDVIHALLRGWPDAVHEKDRGEFTPLHLACQHGAPLAVILLLLDFWLEAANNRNGNSVESLICARMSSDVKNVLFLVSSILNENCHNPFPHEVMSLFMSSELWNAAKIVINMYPSVTKTLKLHEKVMPDYLSVVGKCCSLTTMSMVITNEPDLLEGV